MLIHLNYFLARTREGQYLTGKSVQRYNRCPVGRRRMIKAILRLKKIKLGIYHFND